jgi:hypothetical protein
LFWSNIKAWGEIAADHVGDSVAVRAHEHPRVLIGPQLRSNALNAGSNTAPAEQEEDSIHREMMEAQVASVDSGVLICRLISTALISSNLRLIF